MSKREQALGCDYELYHNGPDTKKAAAEIDAAVEKAAKSVLPRVSAGQKLLDAVWTALNEEVRPVMDKWQKLGSGDTEPEWWVVDVMKEHVESILGIKFEADGWHLRDAL